MAADGIAPRQCPDMTYRADHGWMTLWPWLVRGSVIGLALAAWRARQRSRRPDRRWPLLPYPTDAAAGEAVIRVLELLHKRLLQRWWRRLLHGQPSLSLEFHALP